ncbi:radical SAM superfamily protein [Thermoplasmatales archaeon BRNA1]|nr:radical SAM superfamily protein [Thermoplasmatales archaeon BRNA1]
MRERIPNLRVLGIAGPGDPLANEETFETLALVRERFPDLTLCISTNGLALPDSAQRLYDLGVRFVTVTINAPDEEIGSKIYGSVLWDGRRLTGTEGARILLERQLEGIRKCADLGMLVKANIVMIPEINADAIPDLVKKVKSRGAYIVNILPLIPVPGTKFERLRSPTPAERRDLMDRCSLDTKMMRHCKQCRADAIGLLGEDRSSEFAGCGYGRGDGCGPVSDAPNMVSIDFGSKYTIAVASSSGSSVDRGFGNADRFLVYSVDGPEVNMVREVRPGDLDSSSVGKSHRDHIEAIVNLLDDCDIIAVSEIGDMPRSVIESRKKKVIVTDGSVRGTVSGAGSMN